MRHFIGAVLGLMLAGSAAALPSCPGPETVVALADRVLAGRARLGRLQVRGFGTEAVYLKLAYGGLGRAEALAALEALRDEKAREAADAATALAVTDLGVAAGLARADPDPARALATAGRSTMRAVLLADAGASYFRLLTEAEARLDKALVHSLLGTPVVPILLADQPDPVRQAVAEAAEAAGELETAAYLLADMQTLEAYEAFRARHAGNAELLDRIGSPDLANVGVTLRNDTGPVAHDRAPQYRIAHTAMHKMLRTAYVTGLSDFAMTVVNQTGWIGAGTLVALGAWEEVSLLKIDPRVEPESLWALQRSLYAAEVGEEPLGSVLGFFDWPSTKVRYYAGTAAQSLAVVVARQALAPWVRGEASGPPERPEGLGPDFDWEGWLRVAGEVAAGMVPDAVGPAGVVAAVELLDAAGRTADAAELAAALPPEDAMPIWRDLLQRLDRRCLGATVFPGQALWLGGDILYRF